MRIVGWLLLALALALFSAVRAYALDPTRSIEQFYHTAWTVADGMPASVRGIVQTPDGFLWLGTGSGLYRFDGIRAERVDQFGSQRLPRTEIYSIAMSSDGALWIGFAGDTTMLSRVRHGVVTTYTEANGLPPNGVTQIMPDRAGGVWMRSNGDASGALPDRLAWFDGDSWRVVDGDWGSMVQNIRAGVADFVVARDGTVWATNSTSVHFYRPGMARFARASNYTARLTFLASAPDGRVWSSDWESERFFVLPDVSGAPGTQPPPPTLLAPTPRGVNQLSIVDRDGTIWSTSFGGGLSRVSSLTDGVALVPQRFAASDGLSSDMVNALFEDREGNIWVGTEAGLNRFRPADIVRESRIDLTWVVQSARLAATDDALFVYTGQAREPIRSPDELSAMVRVGADGEPQRVATNVGDVSDFVSTGADLSFTSTSMHGGAERARYTLRGGVRLERVVFAATAAPSDNIARIFEANGASWYARQNLGFYRYQDGRETQLLARPGASPSRVWAWRNQVLALYSDGSLFDVTGDTAREHQLPDVGEARFLTFNDRRILFASEQAILSWDGSRFGVLPTDATPELRVISDVAISPDGEVWMATASGLVRTTEADIDRAVERGDTPLSYRLFDLRDGLSGGMNGHIERAPDGRLWFTTEDGVSWIDPSRIARNVLAPPVVITKLIAGAHAYDMPANVRLAAGSSSLELDFTALSLTIPERNRFRYRLDGVDDDWIDAGDRRQAFYTRLGPGTYNFHVIAANNDGVWNTEGATLRFYIAPTFLQSIWFKFIVALVLCVAIWAAFAFRLRLETARLQDRFSVQIAERERIARELHDTLLQGFQGLMLRFQSIANATPAESDTRTSMNEALDRADEVLVEGRARVRDLRLADAPQDLEQALAAAAVRAIGGEGPEFRLSMQGNPRVLRPLVTEEIVRIVEEALRNAAQHAQARTIEAAILFSARDVRVSIRDDGVGLDSEVLAEGQRGGHYGLVGMRERAGRIGGTLSVARLPVAGTEVRLVVPAHVAYRDRSRGVIERSLSLWSRRAGDS